MIQFYNIKLIGGVDRMDKYGYVRVSSKDQNTDRQIEALIKVGLERKNIYVEKQSGKDFDRKEYKKLIRKLKPGDELYIKAIDRLGRNYDETIEQWQFLTRSKEVDIIVIDFPLLDTRRQVSDITGKFIADLVLQILSYVAQVERENIRQRQAEGIRIAKKKGVKFGRPRIEIPDEFESVYNLYVEKKLSLRQGAKLLNTNHATFSRWVKNYKNR